MTVRNATAIKPVVEDVIEDDATVLPFTRLNSTARRFNETRALLTRFVVFPDEAAADLTTLWTMAAAVRDEKDRYAFAYTARLAFLSDGPGSGKTAALDAVCRLVRRGLRVGDITAPALTSMIRDNVIPFIDEVDELFGKTSASKSQLRAVLNAGYEAGGCVARAGRITPCFGPVALAGMGAGLQNNPAHAALRSRMLAVWMRPAGPEVEVETFRRRRHAELFDDQAETLARWGRAHAVELVEAEPDITGLSGRDVDLWEPLLAIAEAAGGEIAERARAAVRQYVCNEVPEPPMAESDRLVAALAQVFAGYGDPEVLPTQQLIAGLMERDEWADRWDSEHGAQCGVGEILSTMDVRSRVFRITAEDGTRRQVRGYRREEIAAYL